MVATNGRLPGDRTRIRRFKAQAETDPSHGKRPQDRTVEERLAFGVINLDKPSGPSSHQVASWVRNIFGMAKVGHGGTLDPRVTGVLPTALDHATPGVGALLEAGKEYVTVMRLHGDAKEDRIRKAAQAMVGEVRQKPPVRSAVARRMRTREIYYLDILEVEGRDVLFRVGCEAGTYVRNLCVDLGKAVGTRGHMQQLRRTRSGPFHAKDAVTLQDVQDAWTAWKEDAVPDELLRIVQPNEALFTHLPKIVVRDSAIGAVCHGAPLHLPGVVALDEGIEPEQAVLLESLKGEAVALARAALTSQKILASDQGVVARAERVLMPKDTYPKVWKRDGAR